jgi:site-specific DNA recombinase
MQVDGYSLDAQRDKLRKYAAYEDMVIAGEYSDEGFSGKNIQGRQDFQRMLNDIQDCKDGVSYVLVFKLSRFGRNAADVLNSLQLMQDFGVNLICVEDGIDSSKDAGKLMISVLSAVAEIERENIRTQTMAGREQKAREGKWNGGFAPYGYSLENGDLVIAEDEVEVIRVIYDRYIHTNEGVAGVAKYLNRNGFVKKLRQNNTIPGFSRSFVQDVLDNPVYMGKIAYGRRRTEKKQGTRNEMHVVEQSEFPIYDGQHEAIVSEEDWYLAQEKRKINSFKREKVNNPDHAHILSGILKCPCCGKSMYGNIAKAHSKDKKTRYYYYCKNTVTPTGHECSFRLNIEQTEINKFVAKIISAMVNNPRFVEAIQAKIGSAVDTEDMEKQIAVLQGQLKQAFGTKSRLERQMDTLDINDAHYDRKILDLQRRYDEQYDTIEDIEVQIGELQSQIRSIQQEKISGDNIYRLLLAFDEVYHSATEAEQKEFMKAFIERIEMFPEKRKDGSWIKKIVFNFPVPVDGEEVKELPLETETTVEKMGLPVPVQVRVLGGQIKHQNGQDTEIAGDQRIDKRLAEQDTGNQHRVVTQHAHLQAEVRLLPAQEDAQQGHGDVKIGTEVNNRIQMAVIVSFIWGKVENRSRPGGGKDEKHRNCRRDIGQGGQIFSQGRVPMAFFRRVIVQRPAPEYKTEEVTLVDNIHQPQGILRPDFVHFTGNQVEGRHGQIGQHDPQKTVAGANGQVPSGTVKY